MANPHRRLSGNVDGEFYVDDSCINCDTCRQLAPLNFEERDGYSLVIKQPQDENEAIQSVQAAISCPTGSIGISQSYDRLAIREDFPIPLEQPVYYCGFTSPKSFGGSSYLIKRSEGNVLVDSPRYTPHLVNKFEEMGGLRYIFLTHRDDVADAAKYAKQLGAKRIIHYWDRSAQPDSEMIIKGTDEIELAEDLLIIPSSGHTKGHCLLLYDNKFLFTGDHLYWRRDWEGLRATRRMCWYDWDKQVESMKRVQKYSFEWVLPGHGRRINLSAKKMSEELDILVSKMEDPNYW